MGHFGQVRVASLGRLACRARSSRNERMAALGGPGVQCGRPRGSDGNSCCDCVVADTPVDWLTGKSDRQVLSRGRRVLCECDLRF